MGTPKPMKLGGARRDRTADLLHAMQALSQLSYSPKGGAGKYVSDGLKSRNPDGFQPPERPRFPKEREGLINGRRYSPAGHRHT